MTPEDKLVELERKVQDARIDFQSSVRTIKNLFAPKRSLVSDELENLDTEIETKLKEIEQELKQLRLSGGYSND